MTVNNVTPPTISDTTPQRGQVLSANPGTWTFDEDGITYEYQWQRCDAFGANCVDIAGATQQAYTTTVADVGSTLAVEVHGVEYTDPVIPPPDPGSAFFVSDWRTGTVSYEPGKFDEGEPWSTIFSYTNPGYQDCGLYGGSAKTQSPDGRVAVVANPYGSGSVLKCEIRDSDPGLPNATHLAKSEVGSYKTVFYPSGYVHGEELWIQMEIYLPNEFGMVSGGANPFTNVADLHPNSNSGVPALGLGGYKTTNLQLYAGISPGLQRKDYIPLIPANRNRKLSLLIGAKISTSGWVEAWLDGVNTIPRFNVATAEASESGPYWKQGLYSYSDASWPGGKGIIYFGSTFISKTEP